MRWSLDVTPAGARGWLNEPIPGWTADEERQAEDLFVADGNDREDWRRLEAWQRASWRREVRDER